MNTFGLVSVGLLLGIALALILFAACMLIYLTWQQRAGIRAARQAMTDAIAANTAATDKIRTEMTFLLQQVDAERMYQASLGMQRGVRQLLTIVNSLHKIVYAAQTPESVAGNPNEFNPSMEADQVATAGVVGEDDLADQLTAEQWFSRPSRSWPPVTGMNMERQQQTAAQQAAIATSAPPPAPEPLPPVQQLPDLEDAYTNDTEGML